MNPRIHIEPAHADWLAAIMPWLLPGVVIGAVSVVCAGILWANEQTKRSDNDWDFF